MFELRLPVIGIELDALYHNVSYRPSTGSVSAGGGSWQFPITGKVRLPAAPILKPYGEAGVAFRPSPGVRGQPNQGLVLGTGLEVHAIVLRISPELRYARWGGGPLRASLRVRAHD